MFYEALPIRAEFSGNPSRRSARLEAPSALSSAFTLASHAGHCCDKRTIYERTQLCGQRLEAGELRAKARFSLCRATTTSPLDTRRLHSVSSSRSSSSLASLASLHCANAHTCAAERRLEEKLIASRKATAAYTNGFANNNKFEVEKRKRSAILNGTTLKLRIRLIMRAVSRSCGHKVRQRATAHCV